jgi:hypothetical protein
MRRRSFLYDDGRPSPRAAYPQARASSSLAPAYVALLPMGFALPHALPRARWALTPPFHPCRRTPPDGRDGTAVSFLWHSPRRHRHRALPGIVLCGARTFLPWRRGVPANGAGPCVTGDRPSGVDGGTLPLPRARRNPSPPAEGSERHHDLADRKADDARVAPFDARDERRGAPLSGVSARLVAPLAGRRVGARLAVREGAK